MNREFLDYLAEGPLDEFLRQRYGQDAVDEIDLGSVSKAESFHLANGLTCAYNHAIESGDMLQAAVIHRLLMDLIESDDQLKQAFEESQKPDFKELFKGF